MKDITNNYINKMVPIINDITGKPKMDIYAIRLLSTFPIEFNLVKMQKNNLNIDKINKENQYETIEAFVKATNIKTKYNKEGILTKIIFEFIYKTEAQKQLFQDILNEMEMEMVMSSLYLKALNKYFSENGYSTIEKEHKPRTHITMGEENTKKQIYLIAGVKETDFNKEGKVHQLETIKTYLQSEEIQEILSKNKALEVKKSTSYVQAQYASIANHIKTPQQAVSLMEILEKNIKQPVFVSRMAMNLLEKYKSYTNEDEGLTIGEMYVLDKILGISIYDNNMVSPLTYRLNEEEKNLKVKIKPQTIERFFEYTSPYMD